jgi:O-antigen/teichoic acid export membrane protein
MLFIPGAAFVGGTTVAAVLFLLPGVRPGGLHARELAALALATVASALVDAGAGFLYGVGRFRAWARVAVCGPWLYAALLLGTWVTVGLTVFRAALSWSAAYGTWGILVLLASRRGVGVGRPDLDLLREAVRFGLRAWGGTLSRFLNFRVDQILMGFISTESTLGRYAIAVNASEVPLYLPIATQYALAPAIARAEGDDRLDQTLRVFRALFLITTVAIVVAAVVGTPLIPAVFGAAYDASVVPYLCLLPGTLGFAASGVFSAALLGSSRPGLSSLGPAVSLVFGLMLDLALIPPFGATGAAVAASAAYFAGGLTAVFAYRALHRFSAAQLVPRPADIATLREIARPLRRRLLGASAARGG